MDTETNYQTNNLFSSQSSQKHSHEDATKMASEVVGDILNNIFKLYDMIDKDFKGNYFGIKEKQSTGKEVMLSDFFTKN